MTFVWSDHSVERLKELVSQALSSEQIASVMRKEFNTEITRNAVIGKMSRINLRSNNRQGDGYKFKEPKPNARKRSRYSVVGAPKQFVTSPTTAPTLKTIAAIDPQLHCDWVALGEGMCKWPIDDTLYCGAEVVAKRKPYCSIHSASANRESQPRGAVENAVKKRWR